METRRLFQELEPNKLRVVSRLQFQRSSSSSSNFLLLVNSTGNLWLKPMAPNHEPQNPNPLSFIFFFLLFLLLLSSSSSPSMASSDPLISFLVRLQSEALATLGPKNFDPKLYVDLPLKTDLSAAESAFARLPRSPEGAIRAPVLGMFLDEYFDEAGSDLAYVEPVDFVPEPEGFLPNVENPRVRSWALEVHSLWKDLSRRVADEVRERPERHTLLPLPSPVIVPGSRFREVYYWDSYWIVRLVVLELDSTQLHYTVL